jgi:hypothetical protein
MAKEPLQAYQIPDNYTLLSRAEKRVVTIQNLYLNYGWDMESIAALLDVESDLISKVLVKSGHLRA